MAIAFESTFSSLPESLYSAVNPTAVRQPVLIRLNDELAEELGLDTQWLRSADGLATLSGNTVVNASMPIALAYAGHQFGNFVPRLGDGRAVLLGEVVDRSGTRRDIQLKGAGRTPYSRRGDGRAALGSVLREYIVSEAMAALGVPTTRALAAVATGDRVQRETGLPGAVLTRVASSHIRVGTFQYAAARGDAATLHSLADYVIARHFPDAADADNRYLALFDHVVRAQASLVAQWMSLGFIHGVMNTDNMAISGETIDYGPCAFLDTYDPAKVFSSIDEFGRYAFGNQPRVAAWNLARLAEALLPLIHENPDRALVAAQEMLGGFKELFEVAHLRRMREKLGLSTEKPEDADLIEDLLEAMREGQADFTLTFRSLSRLPADESAPLGLADLYSDPKRLEAWYDRYKTRLLRDPVSPQERARTMLQVNPRFIPRNHQIESVIRAAVDESDYAPFHDLVRVLATPYSGQPGDAVYEAPPRPDEQVLRTFCGT
ncbi:protein adenylyltransferase SelO [Roseixanthobacter glucoisosaccharinicivorans]|uniref:protein adenylyltransferase SelO n=1 Tax=Roseixanthobacter glucoisosaccharinicivorans TaxID=3119923 RepID=UPI0037288BF9